MINSSRLTCGRTSGAATPAETEAAASAIDPGVDLEAGGGQGDGEDLPLAHLELADEVHRHVGAKPRVPQAFAREVQPEEGPEEGDGGDPRGKEARARGGCALDLDVLRADGHRHPRPGRGGLARRVQLHAAHANGPGTCD